jgi:hypothetical protein
LRRAAGQEDQPITTERAQSVVEDRSRDVSKTAGKRADLEAIRDHEPDLVDDESWMLGFKHSSVVDQRRRVDGPSSSDTHRTTRLRCWVWPEQWWHRWARATV